MKSTHCASGRAIHRLVCSRCGFVAEAGQAAWSNITSVAHHADGHAPDGEPHEVGLDLCRDCLRQVLRAALCLAPPGVSEMREPRWREMAEVDAYIATSNAHLAALREADRVELVTRTAPRLTRAAA